MLEEEKVIIIESKSIHEYLKQLEEIGEEQEDYKGLYGYSLGQTEHRIPVYDYPEYDFQPTEIMTNLVIWFSPFSEFINYIHFPIIGVSP